MASPSQNSQSSQEPASVPALPSFSSPSTTPAFNLQSQNVDFGSPKSAIFGGSAFLRPKENVFAAPGRQSIFGGSASLSTSQTSNVPKTEGSVTQANIFGMPQTSFSGKTLSFGTSLPKPSEDASSQPVKTLFGGVFSVPQLKSSTPVEPADPTSTIKPNIFGGAYFKQEPSVQKADILDSSKVRDSPQNNDPEKSENTSLFGTSREPTKVSFESPMSFVSVEKHTLFSPSQSTFGRFSSSGMVTSSASRLAKEKSDDGEEDLRYSRAQQRLAAGDPDWIPNNVEKGMEKKKQIQSRSVSRLNKTVQKRGVFGKAIADMATDSGRQSSQELRSIICHPLEGDLADQSTLKKFFLKFGESRVSVNKERRYVVATFKTHEDAVKLMKGESVIDGKKYTFFWRNMSKTRRRSSEETGKLKSPEDKKKTSRRSVMELDPDVREELEAMSGIEYVVPSEISSKRKAEPDLEGRKKSRSQMKLNSGPQEHKSEGTELGKRSSSHISKTEQNKDLKLRAAKVPKESKADDNQAQRSRINLTEKISSKKPQSSQPQDDHEECKQEVDQISDTMLGSTTVPSELLQVLKQQALSSEDKLRVLDARDKLIRIRQVKQYDISKAVKTVGTCPDMCPEKERLLRQTRRQISQYEMDAKILEMDPSLMVKQYSRSSADQEEPLPHDLRPPSILTMTMNYLMHSIMNLGDEPSENLGEWYHFLWDRLRGIRKEITQQELCDPDAVRLVEQCARFHIHCGARLVAEDMSVFDDRINTENLTKCLQTLKHMYHDLWVNNSITCANEPEFITYFILLNLNNGTIMWEMEQLREEVLRSPEIAFVAAMYNSLSSNNFVRFFRLVRKATYLNSCLCIRYFYQVRARALSTYVKALAKFRPVMYPLVSLVEELGFENAERAAAFCNHYGLQLENVSSDAASVMLSQETFANPDSVLPSERAFRLVESKRIGSVGEVVNGGPLPARLYEGHVVHNSFDADCFLRKSAYYAKDQGASDFEIKDAEEDVGVEETESDATQIEPLEVGSIKDSTQTSKPLLQPSAASISFGDVVNQKIMFSSTDTKLTPGGTTLFSSANVSPFITHSTSIQSSVDTSAAVNPNLVQPHLPKEPLTRTVFQNFAPIQTQMKIETERRARADLEKAVNEATEVQMEGLLHSAVYEGTIELAAAELKAAEEQYRVEQQQLAEQQLRAQEELRKRILDAQVQKISSESLSDVLHEVVLQLILELAQEAQSEEQELERQIDFFSEECLSDLLCVVVEDECSSVVSGELKRAKEFARQEAVEHRVRQVFYQWLQRARRSLHRKCIMKDFPASVIPLSIKEHAERWGFPKDTQADLSETNFKRSEKSHDFSELKAVSAHTQTTFAELVGVQAVHRYDTVRCKFGLGPTDQLLYKLFLSVPNDSDDSAAQLINWWMHRIFKQDRSMVYDDCQKGVYRLVSGLKVTSEVAVFASLQMVRGESPIKEDSGLASGTSAVLFTVSPTSNIEESRSRLSTLLEYVCKLPALPLVVAVVSPSEPPLDGLKQLVLELHLDQWLNKGVICDYQILHVDNHYDVKYLTERFNMAFNYMVMTWTPSPEFSVVCLKNVLMSTFQMFIIAIQFNYNSSEVYPQDVDDPRIIIGLCNEWLECMHQEFVSSFREAKVLCGVEFWPLIHKGAYHPFFHHPNYERLLAEAFQDIFLPPIEWPPSSEEEFETLLTEYCCWLRPAELKQTQKRLSCLNGLSWPEKIKGVPWINLVEDWLVSRICYSEALNIQGRELLCLMRAQNVEHLYTDPWWARSKLIISYLESNGLGSEYDMDVDQTVPSDNSCNEGTDASATVSVRKKSLDCPKWSKFEEVKESVKELKNVNESLMTRIKSALVDDCKDSTMMRDGIETGSSKTLENSFLSPFEASKSSIKDVGELDQDPYESNVNNSLLSPKIGAYLNSAQNTAADLAQSSKMSTHGTSESQSLKEINGISGEKKSESSKRMEEIMTSMKEIVSSLDEKYQILSHSSKLEKITGLKMGRTDIDISPSISADSLHPSSFVEQSQRRMKERLQRMAYLEEEKSDSAEEINNASADSDLEILSDEGSLSSYARSVSSPSSQQSYSKKSRSPEDVDNGDYSRRQKQYFTDESEEAAYSDGSDHSVHGNECDSVDEEEVQTISSGESMEQDTNHLDHDSRSQPTSSCYGNAFGGENNANKMNSDQFDTRLVTQNGHFLNEEELDQRHIHRSNMINNSDYYDSSAIRLDVEESDYLELAEDVIHAENVHSETVHCNSESNRGNFEPTSGNDHQPQPELSENAPQNIYEVDLDEDDEHSYGVHNDSDVSQPTVSDEDDDYGKGHLDQFATETIKGKIEDPQSEIETYDDLDEEEVGEEEEEGQEEEEQEDEEREEEELEEEEPEEDELEGEEQEEEGGEGENDGEADSKVGDSENEYEGGEDIEEEGALDEEEDEEIESEVESNCDPDEDSDVCEVIDD